MPYLSFELIKVVDDDSNEQIEREERSEEDEDDKEGIRYKAGLARWLHVDSSAVNSVLYDFLPPFKCCLSKRCIRYKTLHIIRVNEFHRPNIVLFVQAPACEGEL